MPGLIPSLLLALAALLPAPQDSAATGNHEAGLYDRAVRTLERRYYDREFRRETLPLLAERFAPRPGAGLEDQVDAVQALLERIPASHLALYSKRTHRHMFTELAGRRAPTAGFQVVELPEGWFATRILEGGPADRAGLLRGDRILAIDGAPPQGSRRMDRRSDDAYLPDPPLHDVLGEEGERIRLEVERRPGLRLGLQVTVADWSAWDSAKASARILERDGLRFGYVHFWYLHARDQDDFLARLLARDFRDCDGLVLDLRGRGGFAHMVELLLTVLEDHGAGARLPVVALQDHGSRSGKEVLAWELRERDLATLVGERTAGAVIPASFEDLGDGMVLMYPAFTLGHYTRDLEHRGVSPDVEAADRLPWAAGSDPILAAGLAELRRQAVPATSRAEAGQRSTHTPQAVH